MQPIPFVAGHTHVTYRQRRPSLNLMGRWDTLPSHCAGVLPRPRIPLPRAGRRGWWVGAGAALKSNSPPRPPCRVEPLRLAVATVHGPAIGRDRLERFGAATESVDGRYSALGMSRNANSRPAAVASIPEHQSSHRSAGDALSWRTKLPVLIDSRKNPMRRDRADIPLMIGVVAQKPLASL